ncbi:agrin-like [Anneissia japonica]|uniref:agrin-like n=1 Tax=Anneissia japonica TaxID=1529436 RepID=UPI001425700F|nr:agrin-like [Anneissia japonica]
MFSNTLTTLHRATTTKKKMSGIRGLVFLAAIVVSVFTNTHAKGCKPCPLPTVNDRVCAKDGQTYPSKCYLRIKACVFNIQLKVAHKGSCVSHRRIPPRRPPTTTAVPTEPPTTTVIPTTIRQRRRPPQSTSQGSKACKSCPLPSRNEQVCGIDGLTYPSKCYMKIRGCLLSIHVAVAHKGKCQRKTRPPPRPRKTTTMPPPTTTLPPTTTTLPPTTTLRPTTIRRAYRPEHPMSDRRLSVTGPEKDCGDCPRPYASDAVCGSDSRTHPSVCWLDKLACITHTNIQPVHMGKCVSRTSSVVSVPEAPEVEPEEPEPRPIKTKPNRKEPKYSSCTPCIVADYGQNDIACGSDGHDYPSSCHIELKACAYKIDLTVAHIGGCTDEEKPKRKKQTFSVIIPEIEVQSTTPRPPPIFEPEEEETGSGNYELCGECPVTAYDDIVCGSDGKTYASRCNLQRIACLRNNDISFAYNGECPVGARHIYNVNEPCPSCSLPSSWEQVCGTDGQTYPSECLLNVKACIKGIDIRVKHEGQCIRKRPTPILPEPVATQRPTQRPIERCPTCPIPVPSDKVCGEDGVTYSSRCVLHRRACTRQIRTRLAHEGPCDTGRKEVNSGYIRCTSCPPPQLSDMVCGSDGMTYPSECFLEIKACIKRSSLTTRHTGKCDPRTPNPVITNPIRRRPIPQITPAPPSTTEAPASRWGESCSFECPITFNPVCGTDNLNYPSPCILENFACHLYNPALKVRHRGLCIRG